MPSTVRPVRHCRGLLLLALTLAGCGYTVGYDHAATADGGDRVGLAVVGNQTLRQRFELPLTRALQEQLPIHTGLRPVAPNRAATVLEVEIVDVLNRSMAGPGLPPRQAGVPVREGALEFAVVARLRDRVDGSVRREWQVLDRAELRIAVGETEASALDEAAFDLARKISLRLATPPGGP